MKKKILFIMSLFINLLFVILVLFFINQKGGIAYIGNKLGIASASEKISSPLHVVNAEAMEVSSTKPSDIVFLGDSHMDYFEWGEYFSETSISNQGIAGDSTSSVIERLDMVNSLSPKKIFIMMGVNDLQAGLGVDDVLKNYQKAIGNLKKENPDAEIYVHGLFKLNESQYPMYFEKDAKPINDKIDELNDKLKSFENANKKVYFIQSNSLSEKGSSLPEDLTVDGLHLNKKGYQVWINDIKEYVAN